MKLDKEFIKRYFRLGYPMILSQLVVFLVNNLNIAMMGSLSDKAISGYTIANESFSIYSMLVLGLTGGFHVYIAQFYGDQNKTKYNQVLRFGMKLCLIIGIVASMVLFFGAKPFVHIFIDDAETVQYAIEYLQVFCWTFIPYAINLLWSGVYSMTGKAMITLYSGTINCLLNLLFCYILLYGKLLPAPLGIRGAALALLIARLGESLYLFLKMNGKKSDMNFRVRYPALSQEEIVKIIRTSAPLVANETLFSIAFMYVMKNYSYASQVHLACLTVVNNASQLIFVITQGTSAVIGVMVGGMLGAGKLDEAKANGDKILKLTFLLYAIFGVVLALLSPFIPGFYSLEGELAQVARQMLLAKSVLGFGGMTMCFYNTLRIGGDTKSVFLLDGVFSCIFPLTMSYVFSHLIQVPFLWLFVAVEAMHVVKCFVGYYFYRKEKWLTKLS